MKQSYQVKCNVESDIERDDTSFRVCLCTLLLLLALFGIISIFLWRFEEQTPASYKVLNHQSSSDSSSWLGKMIRNGTKSTLPPPPLVTESQGLETVTTSVHVTNGSEQSTRATTGSETNSVHVTTGSEQSTRATTGSETISVHVTTGSEQSTRATTGSETTSVHVTTGSEQSTRATTGSETTSVDVTSGREYSTSTTTGSETISVDVTSGREYSTSTTTGSETTTTSLYVTTESDHSTSSVQDDLSTVHLFSLVKTLETTESKTIEIEETSSVDDVTRTEIGESSTPSLTLARQYETEASSSTENVESSTLVNPKNISETSEISDETIKTLIYTNPKENSPLTESTIFPSTKTGYELSSGLQDASTSKLFERLMELDEATELTTTEKELEQSTEADFKKSPTTEAETTSEELFTTTLVVETSKLREIFAVDTTTPDLTSADAVPTTTVATSTTMRTTTTTPARVTAPPLTCPDITCPTSSCPECPVVTCPTIPTTTVPTTTAKPEVPVCKSSQCYVTAARILSLVNVSVDPCEDFYSYACGGIFNNPTLLENDLVADVWKRIERVVKNISSASPGSHQKLKKFYNGCVNYDTMVPMEERKKQGRKVLDSVAKFADSSTTPENDFTDLLIRLFQHGSRPLFDLRLDVDSSNSSQFQLVITVPEWVHSHFQDTTQWCKPPTMPADLIAAYEDYKHCMGNFSEFIDTTQKALEFFGVFDYLPAYNASQLIQEIRMSMEFDVLELLREFPPPDVVNKDTQSKTYKLTPKIQLEAQLPMISWSYLFSSLLNVEVSDAANVQVYFIEYIKKFFDQLQTKSARSVHNSLLAMLAHDLYVDLVLTHQSCDRERYCLRVTAQLMPVVSSNLYLESFPAHVDKELRKQVILTYQHLEAAMEDKISKVTWLDEKTSNEISKKLKFMSIQLPRKFNDSILDSSLGECTFEAHQYLEASVCLLKQLQTQLYARYTMDPHSAHAMWPHFLTSFSTETAFIYGLNTFMIPLAVIWPVYDHQMPRHVVMATLGNVLARGIGHNFDHTGVKFVAGGKIGMMLSEATNPTYETVVENSNMQFSWTKSYREDGKIYSYLLDPELTLNQRLSDITAVNLSLSTVLGSGDTILPWTPFSPAQTYFLALAQSFCSKKRMPEMFTTLYEGTSLLPFDRVFNLAANSEQFALAFRCPLGTTMNMASELKTRPFPMFEKEELYVPDYS